MREGPSLHFESPTEKVHRKVCETSGAGKHHDHVVAGVQGRVLPDGGETHCFQEWGTHFALSGNASTDTASIVCPYGAGSSTRAAPKNVGPSPQDDRTYRGRADQTRE